MRRQHKLALLGFSCVALVYWLHRVVIDQPDGPLRPSSVDIFFYFHPAAQFIHDEIAAGRLPLWNPYQLAGQPFAALPVAGALYPLNLLLFGLLEPARGLAAHAILHLLIAGFFTWLLAGRLGLGGPARATAAVAYMLSGSMLAGIYVPVHFSTQAWLPAILWALHGLLSRPDLRFAIALGAFVGLAFLGGYPQIFLYTLQFSLVFAVVVLVSASPSGERLRTFGSLLLAGCIALGLCMPLLLPALEFTELASRSLDGLSYQDAAFPGVSWAQLAEGVVPELSQGRLPEGNALNERVRFPILLLPLLVLGFWAKRQRLWWISFSIAAALSAAFITGSGSPIFGLYYQLPGGGLFRGPVRLAFLYGFLGALLMGIGVQGVSEWMRGRGGSTKASLAVGLLLMVAVGADFHLRGRLTSRHPALHPEARGAPEALIAHLAGQPGRDRVFLEMARPFSTELIQKSGTLGRFFVAGDYEPSLPRSYALFFGAETRATWHGATTLLGKRPAAARTEPRMLDLMSVRFYATSHPPRGRATAEFANIVAGDRSQVVSGISLFERSEALPRSYVVHRIEPASDESAAFAAIRRDSFDPRRVAVVLNPSETAARLLGESESRPAAIGETPSFARIVEYTPQRVTIEAVCTSPCLAVLTDLDYPGWRLHVDGEPAEIERANGLFRGVALEPGEHRLVYRFSSASFRAGLWLAGAALLIALGSGVVAISQRKRGASRGPAEK